MLAIGEIGCVVYGNCLYNLHNFSVNLKLFLEKVIKNSNEKDNRNTTGLKIMS